MSREREAIRRLVELLVQGGPQGLARDTDYVLRPLDLGWWAENNLGIEIPRESRESEPDEPWESGEVFALSEYAIGLMERGGDLVLTNLSGGEPPVPYERVRVVRADAGSRTPSDPPQESVGREPDYYDERVQAVSTALGFARVTINCGEPWTDQCGEVFAKAFDALRDLAPLVSPPEGEQRVDPAVHEEARELLAQLHSFVSEQRPSLIEEWPHAARAERFFAGYTPTEPSTRSDVDGLRPEVLAFARLMEAKLRTRDAQRGESWKDETPQRLWGRMADESTEVYGQLFTDETDLPGATEEAVDVANFAMMIADVCGGLDLVPSTPATHWMPMPGGPVAPSTPEPETEEPPGVTVTVEGQEVRVTGETTTPTELYELIGEPVPDWTLVKVPNQETRHHPGESIPVVEGMEVRAEEVGDE